MRTNWQAARNDKKMVDDMRNLQQSLDVTIKAKMQLEKVNQELLVEKEALQLELEQFRSSLENPQVFSFFFSKKLTRAQSFFFLFYETIRIQNKDNL